eukprot:7518325-Pyramimonas_sp.AAC.1
MSRTFSDASKQELPISLAPPHELLAAEIGADSGDIEKNAEENTWARNFEEHPLRIIENDDRPVYPVALYCDGVRYTKTIGAGRQDTLINFTVHNLCSGKRHLIGVMAKSRS